MALRLVTEELQTYCEAHSTTPSRFCEDIETYTAANVPMSIMLSGKLVGGLLGFLTSLTRARRALDIGTYTGYSALAIAEKLPKDGEVVTLEYDPKLGALAQSFWDKSPDGGKIRLVLGDANQTLKTLSGPFDLIFLDLGNKEDYLKCLGPSLEYLSPNGILVADNTLRRGLVIDKTNDEADTVGIREFNDHVAKRDDLESLLLPVRDGLMLVRKRG